MDNGGDENQYRYVRNNPPTYDDPSGLKIFVTRGVADRYDPIGLAHQDICVDTWDIEVNVDVISKCCTWTGVRCFSFRALHPLTNRHNWRWWWGSNTWLGFESWRTLVNLVPGYYPEGIIYESTHKRRRMIKALNTSCIEDIEWLGYMEGRVGTIDRYTLEALNCIKYTNLEFEDAVKRFSGR